MAEPADLTSSSGGFSDTVAALKARSNKRKQLLAQSLGASSVEDLATMLASEKRTTVRNAHDNHPALQSSLLPKAANVSIKKASPFSPSCVDEPEAFVVAKAKSVSDAGSITTKETRKRKRTDSDASSTTSSIGEKVVFDDYYKVLKEDEKIYKGSSTFLKGTQSANPHNDYSQNFVDSGQRPQNFIRDPGLVERFDEYPKLKELMALKDGIVLETATKPMYLQADLRSFRLRDLNARFDVILIEPPLAEYQHKAGLISGQEVWDWDMIESLDIGSVAESRCFLWIWCGSSPEGTTRGRACLRRWGFRRCEDICWVKRNTKAPGKREQLEPDALFQRTKEHCLMGIKGTVRRSTDGDFIHANVDIDLIITEEPIEGELRAKPEEIFLVAEHFCLGRRRLHLFGRDDTLRPGWVTVGTELASTNYDAKSYNSLFEQPPGLTTGCTERIEQLRPKSPERGGGVQRDKQTTVNMKDKNNGPKPSSSGISGRKDRPPTQRSRLPAGGSTVGRARNQANSNSTVVAKGKNSGRRSDVNRHGPRLNDSNANARRLLQQAKRAKTNSSKKVVSHAKSKSRQPAQTQQHRSRDQQKFRQKQPKPRDRR